MVDYANNDAVLAAVGPEVLANLTVHFQRLLTIPDGQSKRAIYDAELGALLKALPAQVIIPLKQATVRQQRLGGALVAAQQQAVIEPFSPTAFVGHSFAASDRYIVESVIGTLREVGFSVVTGERPRAERISEKVKRLIDGQHLFVGLFTRRERIVRKQEWTTSPWVIDEKAYALGHNKRLLLLKEQGIASIGGLQGDYEFIEFSRDRLDALVLTMLKFLSVKVTGLRAD